MPKEIKVSDSQEELVYEEDPIKRRLLLMLGYDWRRLPYRVASSFEADLSHMVWSDGDKLYYGTGNPEAPIATEPKGILVEVARKLPNPFYRGGLNFYPVSSLIKHGNVKLSPLVLDPAYIEFFSDILAGTLGLYKRDDETTEIWRRYGEKVDHIENIEEFYGVRKPCAGVSALFFDVASLYPEIAPKKVVSGIAIGDTIYGGLGEEPLTDDFIPKQVVPASNIDVGKAAEFFELVCPEENSRHNLLLATVYPYFKRSSEKFFILKGPGGTGKSRYMEHFPILLGEGGTGGKYATVDLVMLASSSFDRGNAIADLQGRLVLHSPDARMSMADKFVNELKNIATADRMRGRKIGNDQFMFKPNGTLFIDTNNMVNLGDTMDIARRRVGIMFSTMSFTHKEFAPYYNWLSTLDGACSLFVYAWEYFLGDCAGKFTWHKVLLNEQEFFADSVTAGIDLLMERVSEVGTKQAYIYKDALRDVPAELRTSFHNRYGIVLKVKRIKGESKRVYMVDPDHTETFMYRMAEAGFDCG
jgi:hypothetical protein